MRLSAKRPHFSPNNNYIIEACQGLDEPTFLVVPQQEENPYMGLGRNARRTWDAFQVAEDVCNEMRTGLPGTNSEAGANAGVWVSADAELVNGQWVIPPQEMAEHRAEQDLVLKRLVHLARHLHSKGEGRAILPLMHKAAEWLKISGEPWQQELTSSARSLCPFCRKIVEADAITCAHCREILDIVRYNEARAVIRRAETALEGNDDGDETPPDELTPAAKRLATIAAKRAAEASVPVPA